MGQVVFVVGAGASTDFHFPIGAGLADQIRTEVFNELDNPQGANPIMEASMRSGQHGDFGSAARDLAGGLVHARSIDRLLETRSDRPLVNVIGKRAIAACISSAEQNSPLADGKVKNWAGTHQALVDARSSWIGGLFEFLHERIRPDQSDTLFNGISFITFNYDRVIEQYLRLAFEQVLDQPRDIARRIVDNIVIEHVYGDLGRLPGSSAQAAPFGVARDDLIEWLPEMSQGIRTFTEQLDDQVIARLHALIEGAALIVFLGFGFDPQNVHALFESSMRIDQSIRGTSLGVSPGAMAAFEQKIAGELGHDFSRRLLQNVQLQEVACAPFVRDHYFRATLAEHLAR